MANNRIEKLNRLAESCRILECNKEEREELLKKATNYMEEFYGQMGKRPAYAPPGQALSLENEEVNPDSGRKGLDELLDFYSREVDSKGIDTAAGSHLGYIPGGGLFASAIGDFISAISNRYAGIHYGSPGAVELENALVEWTARCIGYPDSAKGHLASGGSIANLTAIHTARQAMKLKASNVEKSVVYLTAQSHHCIQKALLISGLGEIVIRIIPMDTKYRMSIQSLKDQIGADKKKGLNPFMVVGNAGSTDMGAIDPLEEMAEVSNENAMWFHIDAAYGGYFILTESGKMKLKGMKLADSVILDPHKGLFLPYGCGIVLVKEGKELYEAHRFEANYMQDAVDEQVYSPAELSPELSKHFRGLRLWLPLKLYGVKVFENALEEKLELARYFYNEVKKIGAETGPEPQLSVVVFRFKSESGKHDELNRKILKTLLNKGKLFLSSTTVDGAFMLRIAILSYRTHLAEIDLLLNSLRQIKSEIRA